jgi:hypothetical protein
MTSVGLYRFQQTLFQVIDSFFLLLSYLDRKGTNSRIEAEVYSKTIRKDNLWFWATLLRNPDSSSLRESGLTGQTEISVIARLSLGGRLRLSALERSVRNNHFALPARTLSTT